MRTAKKLLLKMSYLASMQRQEGSAKESTQTFIAAKLLANGDTQSAEGAKQPSPDRKVRVHRDHQGEPRRVRHLVKNIFGIKIHTVFL